MFGYIAIEVGINENGDRTHSGAKFQCNTIIRILRNKLTCGYMVSGDMVSPHMKELQIIDEKMFERAQYILEQRALKNSDERQIALSTKSQAMLSGVMFCAHCGGRMTSNMHTEKYTVKSTGEVKEKHYLRYICYHRSRKLCDCDGQSVYSAEKVDKAVIEVVASIFSKISDTPDETELRKEYNREMQKCRAKQTKLGTELKKYQKQYDKLNEEIANTLIGESFYSPEQLSTAMTTVQQRITAINQQLEKISNEMEQKKASMEKVRPMYEMFKGWAEEFRMATIEQKKMIVSQVISRIEIGKGYKMNITLNMEYEQFCEGWNGLNNL